PAASRSATSLTFSSQSVRTSSPPHAVMLSNSGSAAVRITSSAIRRANSGDFLATNPYGNSLAASARCTLHLAFTPPTSGTGHAHRHVLRRQFRRRDQRDRELHNRRRRD